MTTTRLATTALFAAAGTLAWSQSAWVPEAGRWEVTPLYVFQTFDRFWMGTTKVPNPNNGDSLDQHSGFIGVEYGIVENLAADVAVGYTYSASRAFNAAGRTESDDGLADTQIGLRYRVLREESSVVPINVTLRAGGVIEGTYDPNFPFSSGDGASGGRFSVLLGKTFGRTGLAAYSEIGYQIRTEDVPDDFLASVGLGYTFLRHVTVNAGYRLIQGLSGPDIGAPGFGTRFGFPQVREITHNFETGIGFMDNGGRYYQFFYARTVAGRNTGEKDVFGFAATFSF